MKNKIITLIASKGAVLFGEASYRWTKFWRSLRRDLTAQLEQQQQVTTPVVTGYTATGRTTIRWGTDGYWQQEIPSSGANPAVGGYYIVTDFDEKQLAEAIKLSNGSGPTSTRVIINDGIQWTVTVRDDTRMTPPKVNDTVYIVDAAGFRGTPGLKYITTVIDANYKAAPKQPGERVLLLESLILIESQTGATAS